MKTKFFFIFLTLIMSGCQGDFCYPTTAVKIDPNEILAMDEVTDQREALAVGGLALRCIWFR